MTAVTGAFTDPPPGWMFDPNVRDQWTTYAAAGHHGRSFTAEDRLAAASWVRNLYVPSRRDTALANAIELTAQRSGGTMRHWLAVDGGPDMGKTDLLVNYALNAARDTPTDPSTPPDADASALLRPPFTDKTANGLTRIPVVYVTATNNTQTAISLLMRSIYTFIGLDHGNASAEVLSDRLVHLLPAVGCRVLCVDDSHMYRPKDSEAATKVADLLRSTLRLPVTFVYMGADIERSALLSSGAKTTKSNASVDQMRLRHTKLTLRPITLPRDQDLLKQLVGGFARCLNRSVPWLELEFVRPRPMVQLVNRHDGAVGNIMENLKWAVTGAIESGEDRVSVERLLTSGQTVFES